MTIDYKNQNDIISPELIDLWEINYIYNDKPLNRNKTNLKTDDKSILLEKLSSINYTGQHFGKANTVMMQKIQQKIM